MRKSILITILCALMAIPSIAQNVKAISGDQFRERVFDYKSDEGWSYKGERACLVDFSTSWCGWCKKQEPIFEELARQYKGQIDFYKIDCEKEQALAYVLGINSYPTILLIRADGKPLMLKGYREKDAWIQIFDEFFFDLKE
jgi:thiol-disulfide isomerase/thioredoxin